MYTQKNTPLRITLAALLLWVVAAFNAQAKEAPMPLLSDVPREFPIQSLKQVASFAAAPGVKGQVIGRVTKDQEIESLEEAKIHALAEPGLQRYVAERMPDYNNFKVLDTSFMLFKSGRLLLVFSVAKDELPAQKVYVQSVLIGKDIIFAPGRAQYLTCVKTTCSGECEYRERPGAGSCVCKSTGSFKGCKAR